MFHFLLLMIIIFANVKSNYSDSGESNYNYVDSNNSDYVSNQDSDIDETGSYNDVYPENDIYFDQDNIKKDNFYQNQIIESEERDFADRNLIEKNKIEKDSLAENYEKIIREASNEENKVDLDLDGKHDYNDEAIAKIIKKKISESFDFLKHIMKVKIDIWKHFLLTN